MTRKSPDKRRNQFPARQDRIIAAETHKEMLPMRYALQYLDGVQSIRCGRLGLIAAIKETRPIRIERILMKGETAPISQIVVNFLEVEL